MHPKVLAAVLQLCFSPEVAQPGLTSLNAPNKSSPST